MEYLTDRETKFFEWLDQCPVEYFLIAEYPNTLNYNFILDDYGDETKDVF